MTELQGFFIVIYYMNVLTPRLSEENPFYFFSDPDSGGVKYKHENKSYLKS